MASLDGIPLTDYYLEVPTTEQYKEYRDARRPALADPLERAVLLAWNGPNLRPETLPPPNYPQHTHPEPSPTPARPLLHSLLASDSPSQGGTGWSLKLVEAVQSGEDKWAQIWRCEVIRRGGSREEVSTVILKLRHQSLFPLPEPFDSEPSHDTWNWLPAKHLVQREATAYQLARQYQGRDLPLCYGFYSFDLPSGESVIGVVLEDLLDDFIPLPTWLSRAEAGNRLSRDRLEPMIFSAFQLQHRLHAQGLHDTFSSLSQLSVLRTSEEKRELVALGFGRSTPRAISDRLMETEKEEIKLHRFLTEDDLETPVHRDQDILRVLFGDVTGPLGFAMADWLEERREEVLEKLPFLELL